MLDLISDLLRLGIKSGEVRGGTDIREAAKIILCVIAETNHEAINRNRVKFLAKAHKKRFDILFEGLKSRE